MNTNKTPKLQQEKPKNGLFFKAAFQKQKLHLWSLGLTVQAGLDFVTHPYHGGKCYYPIFAIILMVAKWSFTVSFYRPPQIKLNRQQRRANGLK